jgi:hypothetical protein
VKIRGGGGLALTLTRALPSSGRVKAADRAISCPSDFMPCESKLHMCEIGIIHWCCDSCSAPNRGASPVLNGDQRGGRAIKPTALITTTLLEGECLSSRDRQARDAFTESRRDSILKQGLSVACAFLQEGLRRRGTVGCTMWQACNQSLSVRVLQQAAACLDTAANPVAVA